MAARKPPPIEPPPNADNPEQSRHFIDMAREVEADETPGGTDRAFEKIIRRADVDRRQGNLRQPRKKG